MFAFKETKKQHGFTLIEVLVVIAIIGLLASVALVGFQNARLEARDTRVLAMSSQIYRALGSNCIADWSFEDLSGGITGETCGNKYPGTVSGAVQVSGIKSQALSFDGDDYVNAGVINLDANGPGERGLTISALFKASQWSSGFYDGRIIDKSISESESDSYFMVSTIRVGTGAYLRFRLRTSAGAVAELIASSGSLQLNRWYLVTARYDGSTMRLYLDGIQVGSMNKTGTVSTNNSPVYIGNNSVLNRPWYGQIDAVRIYEEAF